MLVRWCVSRRDYLLLLSVACTFLIVTVTLRSPGSPIELGPVGTAAGFDPDPPVDSNLQQINIELKECGCVRKVRASPTTAGSETFVLANTTCSEAAFRMGAGQNVFAFSFYDGEGDVYKRDYFAGIRDNVAHLGSTFPSFRVRLYHSLTPASPHWTEMCSLACERDNLDLCDVNANPKYGNASGLYPLIWRYLPIMDRQVSTVFPRDLDSSVSRREEAALREFLSSTEAHVHIMRDHPFHNVAMLGGAWGAKMDDEAVRKAFRKAFNRIVKDYRAYSGRNQKGPDQALLADYVFPWAKKVAMAHDSYNCKNFDTLIKLGFPTAREDADVNFVGAVDSLRNRIHFDEKGECPSACRRNQSWTWC